MAYFLVVGILGGTKAIVPTLFLIAPTTFSETKERTMPRQAKRLNMHLVRKVTLPGKCYDENGLILLVKESGAESWVQRLTIRGRRRDLGLGPYPLVTLGKARQEA